MNEFATVSRRGRRQVVELPDGMPFFGDRVQVRIVGRTVVLEPLAAGAGLAPGHYTPETLPPLSEGARKILASIDALAPLRDVRRSEKSADGGRGIALDDEGQGIDVADEGLPGLDPGD